MSNENDKPKSPALGVAVVLPKAATARLILAARFARDLPLGSVARKKLIEQAIEQVRRDFPESFR